MYTYIYIYTHIYNIHRHVQRLSFAPELQRRGFPTKVVGNIKIPPRLNSTFNWEDQQRY